MTFQMTATIRPKWTKDTSRPGCQREAAKARVTATNAERQRKVRRLAREYRAEQQATAQVSPPEDPDARDPVASPAQTMDELFGPVVESAVQLADLDDDLPF